MNHAIPMPPLEYQSLVCGPNYIHLFEEIGRGLSNRLTIIGCSRKVLNSSMWDVDADALPVTLLTAQLSPTLASTGTKA